MPTAAMVANNGTAGVTTRSAARKSLGQADRCTPAGAPVTAGSAAVPSGCGDALPLTAVGCRATPLRAVVSSGTDSIARIPRYEGYLGSTRPGVGYAVHGAQTCSPGWLDSCCAQSAWL